MDTQQNLTLALRIAEQIENDSDKSKALSAILEKINDTNRA